MSATLGIDEAGRGPVIGPLVIAGVFLDEHKLQELIELGVRDSKALTRERRSELAREIERIAQAAEICVIPASELNEREESLTQIELEAMTQLIEKLKPQRAVIDAPVGLRAIPRYVEALRRRLNVDCEIVAENKADARYPVVAAASIVAKVRRDEEIKRLHRRYGDFGWGYPSEPKVRRFLREWYAQHGAFPDCVRLRWRTVQRLLARGAASEYTGLSKLTP